MEQHFFKLENTNAIKNFIFVNKCVDSNTFKLLYERRKDDE